MFCFFKESLKRALRPFLRFMGKVKSSSEAPLDLDLKRVYAQFQRVCFGTMHEFLLAPQPSEADA